MKKKKVDIDAEKQISKVKKIGEDFKTFISRVM